MMAFAVIVMVPGVELKAETAPQAMPKQSTATRRAILSDVQIQKLLQLGINKGVDLIFHRPMPQMLRLGADVEEMRIRQLAILRHSDQTRHGFQKMPHDQGYVFILNKEGNSYVYRTNVEQELIAAVLVIKDGAPTAILSADAQIDLVNEITFWVKIADKY